jgi:hypothetical protein
MGFSYFDTKNLGIITVILIAVLIGGFLIGYLPARSTIGTLKTQNSRLEQRNAVLEQSLKIAELRGAVGLMAIESIRITTAQQPNSRPGFLTG